MCESIVTSFLGALWFVNRHRADRLVAAAQVTERHSGIQHVKQGNLWKTEICESEMADTSCSTSPDPWSKVQSPWSK